ncbi:MAG: hypothetical protein LBQ88_15965 [Treponema sp.]|jgi:hypothetical protein|nr:hypothetical protein [Treponema sp.]
MPYWDVLDFEIEHSLTREPLRIDLVIIKKKKDVVINKNIAVIFRGHNIMEYKSPDDSLAVADFHKVMAYAHLYCTPPENGDIRDMTVSFVTSREPREVKAHLRDVYGYRLTEKAHGITLVEGDVLPMQIIERKKLSATDDLWLASLGGDLDLERTKAVLEEAGKIPRNAPIRAYLSILLKANEQKIGEVMKMSDITIFDEVCEAVPAWKEWKAKLQGEGATREKARGKAETARLMKADNEPVSKIIRYTGLTEEEIRAL